MTKPRLLFAAFCVCAVWLGAPRAQTQTAPAAVETVIQAGRLIDGTSTTVRERVTIVVRGDKVIGVQDGFQAPAGARVIDLRTSTVMPGLIDTHTHITGEGTGNAARHRTNLVRQILIRSDSVPTRRIASRSDDVSLGACRTESWVPFWAPFSA